MEISSGVHLVNGFSLNLDRLLFEAKNLEQHSEKIIKEVFENQVALYATENIETIKYQIESLKKLCFARWETLNELQQSLKGYQAIKKSSSVSKKTQILIYEKELLSQEILSLEEKFEESPNFEDPIICRVNAENSLITSIRNHRQLIIELNSQIGILDLKCENSKKDLFDLKAIGLSLKSKIKEKKEAIEIAPRSEVEKRKQKMLSELELQVKRLTKILFQLVDKHYPAKSLQSSVESHFLKLDLSVPSLKSILETLIKQSIENPNQYHQLPWGLGPGRSKSEDLCRQAWEPYLNVLYLSYLIQFHPSDPSQVRLTNYRSFE